MEFILLFITIFKIVCYFNIFKNQVKGAGKLLFLYLIFIQGSNYFIKRKHLLYT